MTSLSLRLQTRLAGRTGRRLVIALPYLWLLAFFLAPFAIVLKISLAETVTGVPPYTPLLEFAEDAFVRVRASVENYALLWSEPIYFKAYLNSMRIAGIATAIALLVGYPMAYAVTKAPPAWRVGLLMLVILPFWTSFLIRVYAWIGLLKTNGLINNALIAIGAIREPLPLLYNDFAMILGLVYAYLPFMVLPLYATLARLDKSLLEAAADLGCRPFKAFLAVTLPLSMPGVIAGCLLVFIPAVGEFIVPDLLGGADALMFGKLLWIEFFANRDWPLASAATVVMVVLLVGPIALLQRSPDTAKEAA
jgi:putrescine transport system permease protein